MKFICKKDNLKNALAKIDRLILKQPNLPILGNVLIKAINGRIELYSTNLEIGASAHIGGIIENEGEVAISPRILAGFLANIKEEEITCVSNDFDLELKTLKHKIRIKGMDPKDFPIIPENPEGFHFKIKPEFFYQKLPIILISTAKNDTRQELNGICVKFFPEKIVFASTDSFRLAECVYFLNKEDVGVGYLEFAKNNPFIIIPFFTMAEISRVVDEEMLFSIDQGQIFISNSKFRMISRLIGGNYPEYEQILPKKYAIEVIIDKDGIMDALKMASLVTMMGVGEILIKSNKNDRQLIISSHSGEYGEENSNLEAKIKGDDFELSLNSRYLIEGLNALIGADLLKIKINKERSPITINRIIDGKEKEDETISYIIMPIIKD